MPTLHRITWALLILSLADVAQGGEFLVHPSLTVSEEYTDNVFETSGARVGDFITRTQPGIALTYKAPALDTELTYQFDYRYYARNSRSTDTTNEILAKGLLTAVENLLFLDVSDHYQRVSLNVTRDVSKESLFVNQTDENFASVSPYFTLHPGQQTTLKTGYRYLDTRYLNSQSSSQGIDKFDHIGFLEVSYELSKNWSATFGYTYTHEEAATNAFDLHQPTVGFRYEYADKSFLFGKAGYSWLKYTDGHLLNDVYWDAGFDHTFGTVTATVNTGVTYGEDPLRNITRDTFANAKLVKHLLRGSLGLSVSYSEYAQAQQDTVQTRTYGGTVEGRYEITSLLSGALAFTAEKYDQLLLDSYTRRFLVDYSLSYLLSEKLTVSLNHIFVDYYSPGIAADNYQVNRVIVAIRKVF
jgi:hypothetical protein